MNNNDQPNQPALVCLVQCSRQRCGHVLTESEYAWTPDPEWNHSNIALCPKCGGSSFYTLNALGQARKTRDTGPRNINPADIEPSQKMGLKMKRRILAAKRRALQIQPQPEAPSQRR